MRGKRLVGLVIPLLPFVFVAPSLAQADEDIYWHIDPDVETCSMVIDPSLTQAQWHRFTQEVGAILSFKSLAPAEPLGRRNFTLGLDYGITSVDQHDGAWINTFTHPDADCPLGDRIEIPTVRARVGVSDAVDLSGFWTTAPGANYGAVGAEVKLAFLTESARVPATAISASVSTLTGVPDFNLSILSMGLVTSKRIGALTPYLGIKEGVVIGTETTDKVDLRRETLPLTQGVIGATWSVWKLGLAAEYNLSYVNTFAFVLGLRP